MFSKNVYFILVITLYFETSVTGYADPGACTGDCNIHDPALIQRSSDGKWFRFTTHQLIGIATADDLSGPWTTVGSVLVNQSLIDLPGTDDPWAPDIKYYKGYYWCFYSICKLGTRNAAVGVAASLTMEPGTWVDKGSVGLTSQDGGIYAAIDQTFIETPEGKMYLSFGSYLQDIFIIEMENPEKVIGDPIQISFNTSNPTHAAQEGSYVYYHEGYYYLFVSAGQCCSFINKMPPQGYEYRITVCRSESVTGPYVDQTGRECLKGGGTTVLASHDKVFAPGGQGVYNNILYYHYVDTDYGYGDATKLFGWNNLTWVDGWPTV